MSSRVLTVSQLFQLLLDIDQELATATQNRGCPYCGGKLYCGDFARKPRGCPKRFVAAYSSRLSFDCSKCRRQTTPPSVRFLDRRVYLGAVLVPAGSSRPRQRSWLSRLLRVPERMIERWRQWWQRDFVATAVYRSLRGQFLPRLSTDALPTNLLERLQANGPAGVWCASWNYSRP